MIFENYNHSVFVCAAIAGLHLLPPSPPACKRTSALRESNRSRIATVTARIILAQNGMPAAAACAVSRCTCDSRNGASAGKTKSDASQQMEGKVRCESTNQASKIFPNDHEDSLLQK
jgi:hypothetical protein